MTGTFNKSLAQIAGAVLLLGLLTALFLGELDASDGRYRHALQTLDRVSSAESALLHDIASARLSLLSDDGLLAADVSSMSAAVADLRAAIQEKVIDPTQFRALEDAASRQAELTKRFAASQAVLRQSLATLSIRQAIPLTMDRTLIDQLTALDRTVLQLLLGNAPVSMNQLQTQLDALAGLPLPPGSASDIRRGLLQEGQKVRQQLPELERLSHDVLTVPVVGLARQEGQQLQASEANMQRKTWAFRFALYAVSLMLLLRLVLLGLHLRISRLALQERAAIKQTIAEVSTRFIGCDPGRMDVCINEALGVIGRRIGLDRVYVIRSKEPALHIWTRQSGPLPPDWPDGAVEVAGEAPLFDGILQIPATRKLRAGPVKLRLEAAGVRGWAGVPLSHNGIRIGLLGFDVVEQRTVWPRSGIDSLLLIGQAIEEALWSEHVAREREVLQSRLRQAQRLETAGTIASGLAHNFNNIVGAILAHAEIAAERLPPSAPVLRHIEEIRTAGERARDLVDRMLQFGRHGAAQEVVSMRALVAESVSLLRVSLPTDVTISVENEASGALVVGEPTQLQQVIVNLLRNATQAVGNSGHIRLQLSMTDVTDSRPLTLGVLQPGVYVRLSVNDTGHGMDAATLARIFEPFFTTRAAGTGLGLATVADIVREHKGALDVASTQGVGTLFEVWLPYSDTGSASNPPQRGQGEIVLVVHEDRARLLRIEDMLAALGYEPAGFSVSEEALASLARAPPDFDMALLDATRPDQDAVALAERLRAVNPGLPIILIGDLALTARFQGSLAQAIEVVIPPPASADLAAALARCLNQMVGS